MVRKTTLCSTLLAVGLLAAAGASPAMAAELRVATDQLTANQTVTISDIPAGHQAGTLTLYRIADYTAASVDGNTLVSYDVHATGDKKVLTPSVNDTDPSKTDSSASADEQLAYVLQHYKSANNKADNYGLYSSLLRDSVGTLYSGNTPSVAGLPNYSVTFSGTSASVEVPAGVYVMTDTSNTGIQCQASLFATGVGGATAIGDTTLNQTVCKHVTPEAPVKKVIDSDDSNTAKDLAHVSTGDIITWQISAKAGWGRFLTLHDQLPAGLEFVKTVNIHSDTKGDWKSTWFTDDSSAARNQIAISTETAEGRLFMFQLRQDSPKSDIFDTRGNEVGSNWKAHAEYGADNNLIINPDETVVVTFQTRVSDPSKLTIDGDGNVNRVERFWEQNASEACSKEAYKSNLAGLRANCGVIPGTSATVKTHQVTLKKTNMSDKALNGAHFTLTRNGEGVEVSNGYVSGYGTATDLTVDGSLTLKGLDTGDYVLTETTAPTGYNTTALPSVTFTMNEDGTITEKSGDLFELVSAEQNTVTVKNAKNLTQLPLTGAGGVMLATVVALMLVAAGVVIEARRRA